MLIAVNVAGSERVRVIQHLQSVAHSASGFVR